MDLKETNKVSFASLFLNRRQSPGFGYSKKYSEKPVPPPIIQMKDFSSKELAFGCDILKSPNVNPFANNPFA